MIMLAGLKTLKIPNFFFQTNETESALKRELGVEAMIECAYDKVYNYTPRKRS